MSLIAVEKWSARATTRWLHGLWEYYREYTHTAIHAASVAALTAIGLLVFVDRLFAVLAIATYVCPPVLLYSIGSDAGKSPDDSSAVVSRSAPEDDSDAGGDAGDSDSDGSGRDSDSDSGDADSDSDGSDDDFDSDGDDGDTDG